MIFVSASDDDDPEKVRATIVAVHKRLHAAVETALVGVDPIDAKIIKVCLSAKTHEQNPSYDGKLQMLNDCFSGLLQVLRELRGPDAEELWTKKMAECEAAVAVIEKEIAVELRNVPVH